MTLQEIVHKIHDLSIEERKELIGVIVDTLTEPNEKTPKRSIMELAGLGAEIWQDIDTEDYVKQLRSEWEHRP